MNNKDALARAIRAIELCREDTESFRGADMASHEIMGALYDYLKAEFKVEEWNTVRSRWRDDGQPRSPEEKIVEKLWS